MFFCFPSRTDAPLYFRPVVTVVLLLLYVLRGFVLLADPATRIHPLGHLITFGVIELMLLWSFGMVVEGKIGWLKFLPLVAILYGMELIGHSFIAPLEGQEWLMVGTATLFALMGLAVVWAPENDIDFYYAYFYSYFFVYRAGSGTVGIAITSIALLVCFINLIFACLASSLWTTPMLNFTLLGMGITVGIALVKLDLVECENWDLLSVLSGRPSGPPKRKRSLNIRARRLDDDERPAESTRRRRIHQRFRNALAKGDIEQAHEVYTRLIPADAIDETDLRGLIRGLQAQGHYRDSLPVMSDYVQRFPSKAERMRLKMAEVLIRHETRPQQALAVLQRVRPDRLTEPLKRAWTQLKQEAQRLQEAGVLEIETEEW